MSSDNKNSIVLECNESFEIERIRQNQYGDIFFTLTIDGYIHINGCRLVTKKDGMSEFVSFPSYKGSDGKYYSHVYVELEDEETEEIAAKLHEYLEPPKKDAEKQKRTRRGVKNE